MQVTMAALLEARPALGELAGAKLPLPLALRVAKIAQSVHRSVTAFERTRQATAEEYAVKEDGKPVLETLEDGRQVMTFGDQAEAFGQVVAGMLGASVDVPFAPLRVSEFPADCRVSAMLVAQLGPLLVED